MWPARVLEAIAVCAGTLFSAPPCTLHLDRWQWPFAVLYGDADPVDTTHGSHLVHSRQVCQESFLGHHCPQRTIAFPQTTPARRGDVISGLHTQVHAAKRRDIVGDLCRISCVGTALWGLGCTSEECCGFIRRGTRVLWNVHLAATSSAESWWVSARTGCAPCHINLVEAHLEPEALSSNAQQKRSEAKSTSPFLRWQRAVHQR